MREFLEWVAFRPRSHAEAMDAWQSHCPRFTLWEDALDAGLIELDSGRGRLGSDGVRLTARGKTALLQSCISASVASSLARPSKR